MAKALGSWSGMRKYLESDMLASTLKGRIRYSCTTFVGYSRCGYNILRLRMSAENMDCI